MPECPLLTWWQSSSLRQYCASATAWGRRDQPSKAPEAVLQKLPLMPVLLITPSHSLDPCSLSLRGLFRGCSSSSLDCKADVPVRSSGSAAERNRVTQWPCCCWQIWAKSASKMHVGRGKPIPSALPNAVPRNLCWDGDVTQTWWCSLTRSLCLHLCPVPGHPSVC